MLTTGWSEMYKNHCWRCGPQRILTSANHIRCSACNWLICDLCGACDQDGCHAAPARGAIGEMRAEYPDHWAAWERYARTKGVPALPAPALVVARWLEERSALQPAATVRVGALAVEWKHREAGRRSPIEDTHVRQVLLQLREGEGAEE